MSARPEHASPAQPESVRRLRWALARDEREQRAAPKLDTFPPSVPKPKSLKRKRKR